MTTCGLTYFGAPNVDEGAAAGAAWPGVQPGGDESGLRRDWRGDEYELWVSGQDPGGAFLRRKRRAAPAHIVLAGQFAGWSSKMPVTNEGYETTPHMLLYHCNLGYPVLSETRSC